MKNFVVSAVMFFSLSAAPAIFANDQVLDHNPGGSGFYEISRAAYALADAGEYMANVTYRGGSLSYAANNVHMAASRLYHLTNGRLGVNGVEPMDHNEPSDLPSDIHYAVEAVEQAYTSLDYEYRRYSQVDYRTQQAYNAVYSRYQSLMMTVSNH